MRKGRMKSVLCFIVIPAVLMACSHVGQQNNFSAESSPSKTAEVHPGGTEELEKEEKQEKEPAKSVTGYFDTTLEAKQEGDRMKFSFSVRNTSGKDLQISYSSGQKYDIYVYNEANEEIYRWSVNKAFTQALIVSSLKKADTLSFTEVWDLKDNQGKRVPKGRYTIQVRVMLNLEDRHAPLSINPDDLSDKMELELN
ncbi:MULTISPECIES: BsuPI-related putative proteinase inhibitor [unclassified Paenibacillus]|uniref:BsuPI-related putative proteinase inhibitor n=1 Tax=unclassified Paenibacillus TaxID=185978 RepID=UPI00211730E8|nr:MULTISPECIES: BsuPI-related putative proteinase inhibitor [unclassified Paenibacillus]